MKLSYLDTSAAMKLVVAEPESPALVEALSADRRLVASWLLHTEMYCAACRAEHLRSRPIGSHRRHHTWCVFRSAPNRQTASRNRVFVLLSRNIH